MSKQFPTANNIFKATGLTYFSFSERIENIFFVGLLHSNRRFKIPGSILKKELNPSFLLLRIEEYMFQPIYKTSSF